MNHVFWVNDLLVMRYCNAISLMCSLTQENCFMNSYVYVKHVEVEINTILLKPLTSYISIHIFLCKFCDIALKKAGWEDVH